MARSGGTLRLPTMPLGTFRRVEFSGTGSDGRPYVILLDRPYVHAPTPHDPHARTLGLGKPRTTTGQRCRMISATVFEVVETGVRIEITL